MCEVTTRRGPLLGVLGLQSPAAEQRRNNGQRFIEAWSVLCFSGYLAPHGRVASQERSVAALELRGAQLDIR